MMSTVDVTLRSLWGTRSTRMLTVARLAGLAALLWGSATRSHPTWPVGSGRSPY